MDGLGIILSNSEDTISYIKVIHTSHMPHWYHVHATTTKTPQQHNLVLNNTT